MLTLPPNLVVRRARDADLPEMARVHQASYPGGEMNLQETVERFRSNPRLSLEDYWVCEKGRRIAGLFALYDFQMYRAGTVIPAGGIGTVAVAPEARRERIAYWMMARAVEIMDQNSIPLSLLYPFRHSFYENLGWGLIGFIKLYKFAPESLPKLAGRENVVPILTADEQETVMNCYNLYAQRQNGTVRRGDPFWNEVVFKNAMCYAYQAPDSGAIEGYVTYRYKPYPNMEAFLSADIEVWDFVWNSKRALHGLLAFLGSQRDQVRTVIFPDQTGIPLEHILREPLMPGGKRNYLLGAETAHFGSNLMGRIVQLRRALTMMGKIGEVNGEFNLVLTDDLNQSNSEPITITIESGRIGFKKQNNAPITLSTNISTFSSLYWGSLNLKDAVILGKVELEGKGDAGFIKSFFDVPRPICLDHF